MHDPRLRYTLWFQIPPLLLILVPIVGDMVGASRILLLLLCSVTLLGGTYLALPRVNRWHGYIPTLDQRFEKKALELPLVSDNRDFFGEGPILNHIAGPGWDSFEVSTPLHGRRWYFVVELATSQPELKIRPFRANNGTMPGDRSFASHYVVDKGSVPAAMKQVLDGTKWVLELQTHGRYLIATDPTMTGRYFGWWLEHCGSLVLQVAKALDDATGALPTHTQSALPPSNPARNVWQPASTPEPEPLPETIETAWNQPRRQG